MLREGSLNHIMMGTQLEWYYKTLAGINANRGHSAWTNITFHPRIPRSLPWVSARIETVRGTVASSWEQAPAPGVVFSYNFTVPVGSVGTVVLPGTLLNASATTVKDRLYTTVWENGAYVPGCSGVFAGRVDPDTGDIILQVESESYMLTCS